MRGSRRAVSFSFSVAAAAALSLGACQCDDELEIRPGSVTGRACDEETGQGLPNARVDVDGPTRTQVPTDGDGNFRADLLSVGEYTLVAVTLVDGVEVEHTIVPQEAIVVASDEVTVVENTRCRPLPPPPDSGTIDGQVCNRHTGELINDATVEVIAANDDVVASGPTDAQGNFEVTDVPEGDHVVCIRAPNYSRCFPVTVVKGETVTFDLAEGGCAEPFGNACHFVGSMCDPRGPDGTQLAGAVVRATALGGLAQPDVVDQTDTAGEFYLSPLLPGRYNVTVTHTAAGVNETFADVACVAGEETPLVGPDACADRTPIGRVRGSLCILDPNELRGRFTGTVVLRAGAIEVARTETDADGEFAFNSVPVGTYEIHLGVPALRIISPVRVTAFQTTFTEEVSCPQPADLCEEFPHQPQTSSDGRILFVVDRSGSMGLSVSGGNVTGTTCNASSPAGFCGANGVCDVNQGRCVQNKWSALKGTLSAVTQPLASTIQYGLFAYPDPANDGSGVNCAKGVQRQAMGATASQINTALGLVVPTGGTPTALTMSDVRTTVNALRQDQRPLAVVLATDGAPNCNLSVRDGVSNCRDDNGTQVCNCTCTSNAAGQSDTNCAIFNCLDEQNTTGAIGQIATLGVQTHVIGIQDANIPAGQLAIFNQALNNMAVAGGAPLSGTIRFHQATSLQALQASLEAVTRRILACQITVPRQLAGATTIEVRLGNQPIPRDVSRRNGWDQTGGASIQLFGSACDAATASLETVTVRRCEAP